MSWHYPDRFPTLSEQTVQVWRIPLDVGMDQVKRLRALLSADEVVRADRFVFPHLGHRFTVARGTMREILGRYLEQDPATLSFTYGPHGKPDLEEQGETSQLTFNLSHSGALALLAVSTGRVLGIDIEQVQPERASVQIARRFFAPQEVAVFAALPESQWEAAFFNGWTRKEAYIKAIGKGLSMPLNQFVVSLAPGDPPALLQTLWHPPDADRWRMEALEPGPGYAGALIAEGHNWHVQQWAL